MEGNLKINISETNRGKEQIIIDRKFKYNFSKLKKDNTKIYRCTEYKTLNKCKSFIILNYNKEILNYESSHNHHGNEINTSKSLIKHKIKDEIKKSLIPSDTKSKGIFDKISQEIGYICPEYKTIKTQIIRYKNKQLFPNIKAFDEAPNESEYNKTIRAKLFMENKHIFADGTFLIAPTNSYQVFITRTYVTELNCFYTTSMSILKNKEQTTYEILINEIKKKIQLNIIQILISQKKFFIVILKKEYLMQLLMTKKNKLCYKEVKDHNVLNTYYKAIFNLCFINIKYIPDIFNKIKISCKRYESTLNTIQFEESISYYDYQMRIKGIWRKKGRISERVDEINILVEYYKNMEAELKNIGCSKNDIIENWFNCLIRLNNKIINFNKSK
ncbi:hypothetical protein U3516DRAFT_783375 [Neocallimastix sp. 'constans']